MLSAEISPIAAGHPAADQEICAGQSLRLSKGYAQVLVLTSVLLVIPCWWQPRIEAGDLASHAYNVWLTQLIRANQAPGLWIAHQSTNVLFDALLGWLAEVFGISWAQKIAVSILVLLFFWGAFALVSQITQKRPLFLMPFLAILSYGTVFDQGLFNYYLAVALSLVALALVWQGSFRSSILAWILLLLAWSAQPLPPMLTAGVYAYAWSAGRLPVRLQPLLLLPALGGLAALRVWLLRYGSSWDWKQLFHGTGLDQSYLLGHHFRLVTIPMVGIAAWLIIRFVPSWRRRFVLSVPLQIYLLCLAAIILIPNTLAFPWYKAQFGAVPERIGWMAAVFLCAVMAEVDPPGWYRGALVVLAALYFSLLYWDGRAMNRIEEHTESLVAQLPPKQRVIARLYYPLDGGYDVRAILDRACIQKCISFGNYEPATLQFRVRAVPGNSLAAWSPDIPVAEQYYSSVSNGTLYEIYQCGGRVEDLCIAQASHDLSDRNKTQGLQKMIGTQTLFSSRPLHPQ
jgi:hypothetical protein